MGVTAHTAYCNGYTQPLSGHTSPRTAIPRAPATGLARSACERVLGAITAAGAPLLAPAPDGFADLMSTMAAQNLARAWAIEVGG